MISTWRGTVRSLAVLVIMGWVTTGRADTISDFETGTTDGWASVDGIITLVPDNSTASQGEWSLRIDRSAGGWSNTMSLNLIDSGLWGSIANNSTLLIDFKATGGSGVPAWWWNIHPIVNSETGGWSQQPQIDPVLNGEWQTLSWNYTAQPADPGGWGQFFLATNTGDVATVWIDNIRVVPEPTAWTLLLAGVCLIRRRRRRPGC